MARPQTKAIRPPLSLKSMNADLNFNNFIADQNNRVTLSAALQVAEGAPCPMPLYLYGEHSSGKTHLAHAIGNRYQEKNPSAKVLYTTADDFVSEVVNCYQRKDFDVLQSYYRSLDMLIFDQIDLLCGKQRAQQELLLIAKSLLTDGKSIIFISSEENNQLIDFDAELEALVNSGVALEVMPLSLKGRVSFLKAKVSHLGLTIAEDAAYFIAYRFGTDLRELYGILKTASFIAKTNRQSAITYPLVHRTFIKFGEFLPIDIETVQQATISFYGYSPRALLSHSTNPVILDMQHIGIFLAKQLTESPISKIGAAFNNRSGEEVLRAIFDVVDRLEEKMDVLQKIHSIKAMLGVLPIETDKPDVDTRTNKKACPDDSHNGQYSL